jgi:hypothetical protein
MAIDGGNWFTHRRQLQNRADAGALAAGVEYAKSWRDCLKGDATVAQQISDKARQYAGDPTFTAATLHNTEVADQSKLLVNINKTGFDATSGSDGGGSCYMHPAGTDSLSPSGGVWTDVKVNESDVPLFFSGFGISPPRIQAQARVQLNPVLSENGQSPLALPVPKLSAVQMRLYAICGGTAAQLASYDLQPLGASHQTLADMTLWGRPNASGDNQPVTVSLPDASTCGSSYIRIGTEVRITGRSGIDINGIACPSTSQQFVGCWTDANGRWGPEIRDWAGAAVAGTPTFRNVSITSSACSPDPYFTTASSCGADIAVGINWPAGCTDTNPSHYNVSVTGAGATVALTPPAGGGINGTWTTGSGAFPLATAGGNDFKVNWNSNPAGGCGGRSTGQGVTLHSAFLANPTNSGIVELVRLTTTANVDPSAGPVLDLDSVQGGGTAQVFLTAGFQTAFSIGPLLKLRLDQSQGNGSINCNNGNQGIKDTYDAFVKGCVPFYGVNNFQIGTWWDGTQCPSPNSFPPNTRTGPWRCAPGAPGLSGPQIADGIAMRVGACTFDTTTYNGGCKTQLGCVPNNYSPGQTPDSKDPRLIMIFLVPYGSFNGQSGGSYSVPVLDFGTFYVTSWAGQAASKDKDLCPGAIPQNGTGEIDGHFVDLIDVNDPPDPTAQCDASQLRPCVPTLIR